jgi:hypothetical protein
LKQNGNGGIFSVRLDEWEMLICNILTTSVVNNGFGGVKVEFEIVKEYCKKYEVDIIDTFQLIKRIANEVYRK